MSSTEFRTKIKHLRQKISKLPVVLDLIGGLAYLYAWLAGKTGKFDVSGIDEFEKLIADNDGGIFVAWHGRALMLPYFWRNPRQRWYRRTMTDGLSHGCFGGSIF